MLQKAAGFIIFRRLNNEIQYLLLKASYGKKHWSTPKGYVDAGEDDFTAAVRETKEESGYDINDLCIFKNISQQIKYIVKGNDKIVTYWLAKLKNNNLEPKLSDEHTEYQWVTKELTFEMINYEEFINMIQYFHNEILNL